MSIRRATVDDLDAIVDMGQRFIAFGPHGKYVTADREQLRAGVAAFLQVGAWFLGGDACLRGRADVVRAAHPGRARTGVVG